MEVTGTLWWDFDGTLVSRPGMWPEVALRLLDRDRPGHGVSPEMLKHALETGMPWHRPGYAHPDLKTADLWWDAVYHRYAQVFADVGCHPTLPRASLQQLRHDIVDAARYHVFEDVAPALTRAAADGWRNVVVSNHVPELPELMKTLGLDRFFESIVTSGVVGYEKPHRRLFEEALRHTRPGAPVWMIGDNVDADCRPVCALGMRAVLVRTHATPAFEHEAPDLLAALDLIERAAE